MYYYETSWTEPALGVKVNGTTAQINQQNICINRSALFFGQWSKICEASQIIK